MFVALTDPANATLHASWIRTARGDLEAPHPLLEALVGATRALPDFLTPRPKAFSASFAEELAAVRATPARVVRHDLRAAHAPQAVPRALAAVHAGEDAPVLALRDAICAVLAAYWSVAVEPYWARMRLVLEADTTYRARRLALGGARLLFADMHPNLRWHGGALQIADMIGRHLVAASGRGLLLVPSVFAYKPVPPISAQAPPWIAYPARGIGTLWAPVEGADAAALTALLGRPRARLLRILAEPLPTAELARRLAVTPSAVSQHLQVLHANGLLTRSRAGRQVLYRRTELGDRLCEPGADPGRS